ncbi:MAG: efflux RND transporter periplasmic adaptor subunit [Gammaproteobacteria bacterium]|nr:efflux RND transporter periplasmic adaptor subunit [Gammaproteobacteria bacterium]
MPVAILVATVIVAQIITSNPPTAKRRAPSKAPQMTVDVKSLEAQLYQVNIDSFGTVQPRTETNLVSQVNGQITYISDNFRQGRFFEQGETLLKVDDRDYLSDVKIAKASLLDAQQALTEEKARAEQALVDWKRLGKDGEPNDLVLRKPQLEAAKARLYSAEAQLEKAKLRLERTRVVAPYAGRVLNQKVDIGQVISSNTQLATIYATDLVEIRLPVKNQDLPLLDLPEQYRKSSDLDDGTNAKVVFTSTFGVDQRWIGQLVRTEGAIDSSSQQLYVVAQIEDPYRKDSKSELAIKIGQYLQAQIAGRLMPNAIVIPNNAIYQGSYVYVVEENLLKRRNVELLWKNETDAIVKSGLSTGEQLVVTPLGRVSSGTPVSISGQNKRLMTDNREAPQTLSELPEKRQQRIKKMAEQQGISPEQMFEQLKSKRQQGVDKASLNSQNANKQSENA